MRNLVASCVLLMLAAAHSVAGSTPEVCGNGVDDNNNGLVDEGCYPALTTGQCESPLSCEDTGLISPSTGSLHYSLPPDISPMVPFGPNIGMRRFYTSMYAPGASAPMWQAPMGPRWQHSYMTWITKSGSAPTSKVVLHTNRGQDILAPFGSTDGTWDVYTPQTGFHVRYLRQRVASPNEFQMRMLTGETLVYNSSGRLTEIWDTLATPNKVIITYDANGQVSTVTDASGKRRLLFGYAGNLLVTMKFQLNSGGWTDQHTTTYSYTGGILMSVTIGGQLAQTHGYTNNYLTSIVDGGGNNLITFVYDSSTTGRIVRVDTPRGVIGYEFGSSRPACSGQTVLYFHKGNTSSCSIDTDCGSGFLCGGKTGAGSTGQCFRGARCLTISSPSEDVVTTVAAMGASGETCDGACIDVAAYIWNTGVGVLDLAAKQYPANSPDPSYYTTRQFDSNGMTTKIVYGDTDASSANGGGQREVYMYYGDANFPGKVTEIRRKSDLSDDAHLCDQSSPRGCAQTLYTYNRDGQLSTMVLNGTTLNSSNAKTLYQYTTTYSYDAEGKGRLAQIDGPLPGTDDLTVFEYWPLSGNPSVKFDGFLHNVKHKKDSSAFVTQSSFDFDFWGNAIALQDPDGTVSCQTFDAARGFLTQRRKQMAGQSDCSANSVDIVTGYIRDSALRLTQLTRPDASCVIYEYDTRGRLSKAKRRDDCNASSSGDREEFTYSAEGLLIKTEIFDASNNVTKRQELTYFDSRRLEKIINPADTSKWTGLAYEARGMVNDVTGGGGLNRSTWTFNAEGRAATENRYTTSSAFDTWTLLFDWLGDQSSVSDGEAKVTTSMRDDLGRVVRLSNPDLGGYPTLRVYDAANRLTTMKESFGAGGNEKLHTFTFDNIGRPLVADYAGVCDTWNNPDIVRVYDTPSTCPIGGGTGCTNTNGRLAYVKVKLMCDPTLPDHTLDQETWFGYDAAGRVIDEYITDDSGRTAEHVYTWTKNGALLTTTTPSGAILGATFGSSSNNSDADRISALWRMTASTPIIDTIQWAPYGGVQQYNQFNGASGLLYRTRIIRDLGYRVIESRVERQLDSSTIHSVTTARDAPGHVTIRDYYPTNPQILNRYDSYYLYDRQDRILCETTTFVTSCPTSGSNIKNGHMATPPFTHAGDWKTLLRPISGSVGGLTHVFTDNVGTHQIATVNQSDGAPALGTTAFSYDARGDRSSDDNAGLSHDGRTYTYDARRNVVNVRGEYYTGSAWHFYDVASAFDAKNRRVFKSFLDEATMKIATWFFYYDARDRLVEVRYTPDKSVANTYSLFQLFWLDDRLVLYWQTDYPSATTSKRYVGTDETGRPVDMYDWGPGNSSRVWTVNADAWGFDQVLIGPTVYQPVLFAGQYKDDETAALLDDHATIHRPGVVLNGFRTYDPMLGSYLQVDPLVSTTWSTYIYTNGNPVGRTDRSGLWSSAQFGWHIGFGTTGEDPWWDDGWFDDCADVDEVIEGLSCGFGIGSGGGTSNPPNVCGGHNPDKCCPGVSCSPAECDNPWFSCGQCMACREQCRREAAPCWQLEGDYEEKEVCWACTILGCMARPNGPDGKGSVSCGFRCDCDANTGGASNFSCPEVSGPFADWWRTYECARFYWGMFDQPSL